jgi:hypothetical protein
MTLPQDALDSARDAYDSAWLSTHGSHAKSIAAAIEAYLAADTPRTESSPLDDEWEPARTLAARLRSPRPQTGEADSGSEREACNYGPGPVCESDCACKQQDRAAPSPAPEQRVETALPEPYGYLHIDVATGITYAAKPSAKTTAVFSSDQVRKARAEVERVTRERDEAYATVKRVWAALGCERYEDARGMHISELVEELRRDRDRYKALAEETGDA